MTGRVMFIELTWDGRDRPNSVNVNTERLDFYTEHDLAVLLNREWGHHWTVRVLMSQVQTQ